MTTRQRQAEVKRVRAELAKATEEMKTGKTGYEREMARVAVDECEKWLANLV